MVAARTIEDFVGAFFQMKRERVDGFLVISSPLANFGRELLAQVALEHRLPGMFPFKVNVQAGGLLSYGADLHDLFRRAGIYIGKILRGQNQQIFPSPKRSASRYRPRCSVAPTR
jgi:putative ABC transport system substrate-binding protein